MTEVRLADTLVWARGLAHVLVEFWKMMIPVTVSGLAVAIPLVWFFEWVGSLLMSTLPSVMALPLLFVVMMTAMVLAGILLIPLSLGLYVLLFPNTPGGVP